MATNKDEIENVINGTAVDCTPEAAPQTEDTKPETAVFPSMRIEPTTTQDETDLINTVEDEDLKAALKAKRMNGRGRPRKNADKAGGRTDKYNRTSLMVNEKLWAKVHEVSFRETLTMKEIVDLTLRMVIDRYEAKHGTIVPHPEKYTEKKDINEIF